MSEYIYKVGDDFESDDKEYVALKTDKGQQITVALGVSGVPFKGSFDKESIFFSYDSDYKEKHRKEKDYLFFIPAVAEILRMTEGTLRRRPLDIQLAVCKRYADIWGCDTYTIRHRLRDAMMLIIKPEMTDSDKEKAVGKDN